MTFSQEEKMKKKNKMVAANSNHSQSSKHHQDGEDAKAQAHRFVRMPTIDQVEKKIVSWEKKIKALDLRLKDKLRIRNSFSIIYLYRYNTSCRMTTRKSLWVPPRSITWILVLL